MFHALINNVMKFVIVNSQLNIFLLEMFQQPTQTQQISYMVETGLNLAMLSKPLSLNINMLEKILEQEVHLTTYLATTNLNMTLLKDSNLSLQKWESKSTIQIIMNVFLDVSMNSTYHGSIPVETGSMMMKMNLIHSLLTFLNYQALFKIGVALLYLEIENYN